MDDFQEKKLTPADGQTMMLDHRFFHGALKGGFFIGKKNNLIIYLVHLR
jgi:hypothetical protein